MVISKRQSVSVSPYNGLNVTEPAISSQHDLIESEPTRKRARRNNSASSSNSEHREDIQERASPSNIQYQARTRSTTVLGYPELPLSPTASSVPLLGYPELYLSSANDETFNNRSTPEESLSSSLESTQEESDTGSEQGSGQGEDNLESQSLSQSPATMPSMDGTPMQVRGLLMQNFLFINDADAAKTGAAVIAKARSVLEDRRGSKLTAPQAQEVIDIIQDNCEEPETTFLVEFQAAILGKSRKVTNDKAVKDMTEDELDDEKNWIVAAWKKDHLRQRWQIDFIKEEVPQPVTDNIYWNKILRQFPRVKTPRPDISWGNYYTAFTLYQTHVLINNRLNLVGNNIYNVFFILEAKCMNSGISEAENQCLRSGATMVSNFRKFNAAASDHPNGPSSSMLSTPIQYPKVDVDSFAFSLAVAPDKAHMFVHWCLEVGPSYVHWHAHRLAEYSFYRLDEITQLHHDIDNVLDWGVGPRKRKTAEIADRIINLDKVIPQPSPTKKRRTE
ncbi:MAG: hypothetical protein Q9163_000260 [Psora crenata]